MESQQQGADPFVEFCNLCRAGKLFAVQAWLQSHAIPPTPSRARFTPIRIALEKGFHSLLEVLLRAGAPTDRDTLWHAVLTHRVDLVQLMFEFGADVHDVSLNDVVSLSDVAVTRLFIERGADLITGYPITLGLLKAPKPFIAIYKANVAREPRLQLQLDIALKQYVEKGSQRGVALMLWAGANARVKVPDEWGDDEECGISALERAALQGNLETLKRLKVGKHDDLNGVLRWACFAHRPPVIEFLVQLGGDLNHRREEGESCWDHLIGNLDRGTSDSPFFCTKSEALECIKTAVRLGARLENVGGSNKRQLRASLARMSWFEVLDLVKLFLAAKAATVETVADVLNTPKLKAHLAPCRHKVAGLLPPLRRWSEQES